MILRHAAGTREEAGRGTGSSRALERCEDPGEVVALIRQQFCKRGFSILHIVCENHLAHHVDAIALEKHVLGASEADADSTEGEGVLGLLGVVGVAADVEAGGLRTPLHQLIERLELLRFLRGFVAM